MASVGLPPPGTKGEGVIATASMKQIAPSWRPTPTAFPRADAPVMARVVIWSTFSDAIVAATPRLLRAYFRSLPLYGQRASCPCRDTTEHDVDGGAFLLHDAGASMTIGRCMTLPSFYPPWTLCRDARTTLRSGRRHLDKRTTLSSPDSVLWDGRSCAR